MADPKAPPPAAPSPPQEAPTAPDAAKPQADAAGAPKPAQAGPRPVRDAVVHKQCGILSVLAQDVAKEMARNPGVIGQLTCPHCRAKRPVGEFTWQSGGGVVGS